MQEEVILPSEQVTPSSAADSYTGRTPFQSGRPGSGMTEQLDSQQSLGTHTLSTAAAVHAFMPIDVTALALALMMLNGCVFC